MIKQSIDQDIKSAMLSGDKRLVNVLRTVKSAILSAEIAAGKRDEGLADEAVIAVLQKEQKKRAEAATLYDQGGNNESAAEERYEESIIQTYLPEPLSEAEINELIDQAVSELDVDATGQAMGRIIGMIKAKAGGSVDGATVARLVKARLS